MGFLRIPLYTWNTTSRWVKHTRTSTKSTNTIWTIKTRIRDNAAKGRTKFALYLAMNPELVPSPFVRCMHPLTRDIIRFRVGSHNLPVETGRWSRKDREDRVCEVCGVVGDEVHYLYNCTQVQRDDLNVLGDICSIWEQPDIFKLIGRIKSLDILWIHFSWFTNYLLGFACRYPCHMWFQFVISNSRWIFAGIPAKWNYV